MFNKPDRYDVRSSIETWEMANIGGLHLIKLDRELPFGGIHKIIEGIAETSDRYIFYGYADRKYHLLQKDDEHEHAIWRWERTQRQRVLMRAYSSALRKRYFEAMRARERFLKDNHFANNPRVQRPMFQEWCEQNKWICYE